jgi:hypothetical protein
MTIRPEESYFLWKTSWCSLIAAAYAAYQGHYHLVPVPGAVWGSSILYWSAPSVDWRRHLDMGVVTSAFLYQAVMAQGAERGTEYMWLACLSALCYPAGWIAWQRGNRWTGIYIHSLIHILGNISNMILYSGSTASFV